MAFPQHNPLIKKKKKKKNVTSPLLSGGCKACLQLDIRRLLSKMTCMMSVLMILLQIFVTGLKGNLASFI